jgi:hypothetical protein
MALNKVNEEYISVRQKTCALHNACETLLQEQTKLTDNAEAIHEKLSYFQELDSIRARLKSPNLEVNSEAFLALLAKLDSCIEYMSMNSQFKVISYKKVFLKLGEPRNENIFGYLQYLLDDKKLQARKVCFDNQDDIEQFCF